MELFDNCGAHLVVHLKCHEKHGTTALLNARNKEVWHAVKLRRGGGLRVV